LAPAQRDTDVHETARRATGRRNLEVLFDPDSVAIVGASDDESKWGNWLSSQALRMRERRRVHLVNMRGATVLGEHTHRRLGDVGQPIDLAVIAVPPAAFEQAVAEALDAGAQVIIAITAGFGDRDEEGRRRLGAVVSQVRAAGAALLGPNCLGALDSTSELYLLANSMPAGPVGLVSQSGNLALELGRRLGAAGMGFSRVASLGNQADITTGDVIRSLAAHDATEVIAVYCEDFTRGRDFVEAAATAAHAGKAVVVLTVGNSAASRRGAGSHTGALTTETSVIDAACRAAGALRVSSLRELSDALRVLHRFPAAQVRTTGIVSDGGGHAALAADHADRWSITVPEFGPALRDRLRAHLAEPSSVSNPVDLAGAGERDVRSFVRTLDELLSSSDVDSVVVSGYFGGFGEYGELLAADEIKAAQDMASATTRAGKPVVVHSMFPAGPAAAALESGGVPVFDAAEDAVAALAALRTRPAPAPVPLPRPAPPVGADDYWSARELMVGAGVPFPAARVTRTAEEAERVAHEVGFPVVVKALGLTHKTDAGAVILDLHDGRAVRDTCHRLVERLDPPGFVVEAMVTSAASVELIVGVRQDPRFGPVGMVGLGGIHAEIFRDVACALAPMSEDQARALVESLACAPLLHGARGRSPVDIGAVARVVTRLNDLAAAHPEIDEIEINPLLATPDHALGLDARVVRRAVTL
jgi:acetate---CoA ligase (ADP-forming)